MSFFLGSSKSRTALSFMVPDLPGTLLWYRTSHKKVSTSGSSDTTSSPPSIQVWRREWLPAVVKFCIASSSHLPSQFFCHLCNHFPDCTVTDSGSTAGAFSAVCICCDMFNIASLLNSWDASISYHYKQSYSKHLGPLV